ncbi:MAG: hypothetical protein ACT4PM_12215 [Gemmatimonadales bacterium]
MMILLCINGPAGLLLHYRGNVEFELKMQPGGLARFRREIGKYVNAKDVARLERYMTVN